MSVGCCRGAGSAPLNLCRLRVPPRMLKAGSLVQHVKHKATWPGRCLQGKVLR